jgi:hypothetical protein
VPGGPQGDPPDAGKGRAQGMDRSQAEQSHGPQRSS